MEVKTTIVKSNSNYKLIVGYDISKYKHNFYSSFQNLNIKKVLEGIVDSSRKELLKHFSELKDFAENNGYTSIIVACEPTGGYENSFLKIARECGLEVKYVSGEATSKFKVIESNDSGKNDKKDARVIFSLATQEKTLVCRELEGNYAHLRGLNRNYEIMSKEKARAKNMFSGVVDKFFPDLRVKSNDYYNKTLRAIIIGFKLNPYKISALSLEEFESKVQVIYNRKLAAHAKKIVCRVWESATPYKGCKVDPFYIKEAEGLIGFYYSQIESLEEMKQMYRKEMVDVYAQTNEFEKLQDVPVSVFLMSRTIAETGPLNDFKCVAQLQRYAGLNLKERSSGTYAGKIRISKKGNSLLRKILGQVAFSSFTRKGTEFGEIYHQKKEKRGGFYALTCMMRKGLKMIFGVYHSDEEFQLERMTNQLFSTKTEVA